MGIIDPQDHRKRCKRWDIPFNAHYLTFSCFKRRPFLRSERACRWFLEGVKAAREKHPFDLWAYVLMPEHVHVVLRPHEEVKISSILKSLKLPVARRAGIWARQNCPEFLSRMADCRPNGKVAYRFWQRGGGYDRNLRSDDDIHEKIHYVHGNPVRRGLVEHPEDWPWSSAKTYADGVDGPVGLDGDSIPPLVL